MMSSFSSSAKVCFNSNCKVLLTQSRNGWRRRTGEFAQLCDRCASVYEEGKFCETFHVNASGWRACESCGKQIHCGCIVSFHMFVLLDAGGIECITCARKSYILTPNPAWPPPSLSLPVQPERIKELSAKNWSSMAGSGPVPWRQAPSLFSSTIQSELQPRMPFGVDISGGIDKLRISERISVSSLENKKKEDSYGKLVNGSLKNGASDIPENGIAGINHEEQPHPSVNISQQSSFSKNDPHPNFSLGLLSASRNETNDQTKVSGTPAQRIIPPPSVEKKICSNGMDSSGEAQIRNGRPRGDSRGRNQLLPRYWPRITDQELQKLSADSNSVITPLFEKVLSASDAGRIGRLVLPKRCAEAYFPPISHPEGLPLKVQDLKGREWIFQFRFWPNNNSRMYVLEGVTPCIQSMQLQAGDIVTFSRVEPEGKLVMGCRKAIAAPSDQGNEVGNTGNGFSTLGDVNTANSADPTSTFSEVEKSGYIAKEVLEGKHSSRIKRKNSTVGSKSKRLKIGNEDMIELKLTLEQAQGLFRPPPNHVPTIVVIEGLEFEEYEQDAPIIGRPTIPATDHAGEKIQWAQCENCFKWRRVPSSALFPSRWTCSGNSWDPDRSLCSVAQELTSEQLQDLLPTSNKAASKKMKAPKQDLDSLDTMEGLDTLANLAIQEEGEDPSSSQATTKHPRHRPGCACIVCIQPPSGKGHKHRQSCNCTVCATVKRRFHTLLLKRRKKQSEKEGKTAGQKLQQQQQLPEQLLDDDIQQSDTENSTPNPEGWSNEGSEHDPNTRKTSSSPFKGQIDLNIQPEREEELSPSSDSGGILRLLQDATESYLRQQRFSSSISNRNSVGNQTQQDGIERRNFSNNIALDSSHLKTEGTLSVNTPASTSTSDR